MGRRSIEAEGETWEVRIDRQEPHPGVRALVFVCTTNTSRGWRVAEVPASRLDGEEALAGFSSGDLTELFRRGGWMDYVHDPEADDEHAGGHPLPPDVMQLPGGGKGYTMQAVPGRAAEHDGDPTRRPLPEA